MGVKRGPNTAEDHCVIFKAGWNAAIQALAAACDEQVNRSSRHADRGALYAEVAAHIRSKQMSYD